jgi:cyanate permease
MRFVVSHDEIKKANIPHELFLTNLVGNHILMAVAAGGVAGTFPWIMTMIPIISFGILGFTLWRARRSIGRDPWYVMCHWQVCARRSKIFISMLTLLLVIMVLGWVGYTYAGMMKEAVWALIGGVGILPVMVAVLVLIIIESDALYHASQAKLPTWIVERFPNPQAEVIEEGAVLHHPS